MQSVNLQENPWSSRQKERLNLIKRSKEYSEMISETFRPKKNPSKTREVEDRIYKLKHPVEVPHPETLEQTKNSGRYPDYLHSKISSPARSPKSCSLSPGNLKKGFVQSCDAFDVVHF